MLWIFSFLMGLAFGSFINMLVWRINPENDHQKSFFKIVSGRSHCDSPSCQRVLSWFELMPLLSWLIQGGRCRGCQTKIPFSYFLVELLGGLSFVLVTWRISTFSLFAISAPPVVFYSLIFIWWLVFTTLLAISVFDFKYYLIPDFLLFSLIFLGIALNVFYYYQAQVFSATGADNFSPNLVYLLGFSLPILKPILGAVFGSLVIGLGWLWSRGRGMGFGDILLIFGLGLLFGWPDILAVILFSFLIGTIISLTLISLRRKTMKDIVPFAPFLALGAMTMFLFGDKIIQAYLNLFPSLFL